MPLFEVPGWSVTGAPAPESHGGKKRKRPSSDGDTNKLETAHINFEKLMEKLEASDAAPAGGKKQKKERKRPKGEPDARGSARPTGRQTSHGGGKQQGKKRKRDEAPVNSEGDAEHAQRAVESGQANLPMKKIEIQQRGRRSALIHEGDAAGGSKPALQQQKLTKLQAGLKSSLDGARFRWINEVLYKSDSEHAHGIMRENPAVFEEYHTGFRHQVQTWPTNPVSHYISVLSNYPTNTVIIDLGCGDAALARALVPKGFTVLSFDLVADGAYVIEADTCGRLPLPGSEDPEREVDSAVSEGHGGVVDVVVCALSLMGTNWPNCIREAWRVLRSNGELKIAEVASRFTNQDEFVSFICSFGFCLKSKDDSNTHFTLFDFKRVAQKTKEKKEWDKFLGRGSILKPCEYKRR